MTMFIIMLGVQNSQVLAAIDNAMAWEKNDLVIKSFALRSYRLKSGPLQ